MIFISYLLDFHSSRYPIYGLKLFFSLVIVLNVVSTPVDIQILAVRILPPRIAMMHVIENETGSDAYYYRGYCKSRE